MFVTKYRFCHPRHRLRPLHSRCHGSWRFLLLVLPVLLLLIFACFSESDVAVAHVFVICCLLLSWVDGFAILATFRAESLSGGLRVLLLPHYQSCSALSLHLGKVLKLRYASIHACRIEGRSSTVGR